jgi:beta-lactamase superfamily II metal-dependent hydrolase
MKKVECVVFDVKHGFCSFIKSPNNYGLLIDCGRRKHFSPIKWIRGNYNLGNKNIQYFGGRRIAEAIITHLHMDHFDDVGSLVDVEKPKYLLRDKSTLNFIDQKIKTEKNDQRKTVLEKFKSFQANYTEKVEEKINWGFDFYKYAQVSYSDAKEISLGNDNLINNRSFITAIEFAGKKILFPGDIEIEGWKKAFENAEIKKILANTNFFVASHHGHKSGFTCEILEYTGKPHIYIVSAISEDQHIDTSYSNKEFSKGYVVEGEQSKSRMISTRHRQNSIKIVINEDGSTTISIIDTPDNLNKNQARILARRNKKLLRKWGAVR